MSHLCFRGLQCSGRVIRATAKPRPLGPSWGSRRGGRVAIPWHPQEPPGTPRNPQQPPATPGHPAAMSSAQGSNLEFAGGTRRADGTLRPARRVKYGCRRHLLPLAATCRHLLPLAATCRHCPHASIIAALPPSATTFGLSSSTAFFCCFCCLFTIACCFCLCCCSCYCCC